jgi:hypothetical protein
LLLIDFHREEQPEELNDTFGHRPLRSCVADVMPEFDATPLLSTRTVAVWNVRCPGHIRQLADEECATSTHLIFPYRGVYVHHVGGAHTVVEASQVLFINENEPYRVSHPIKGPTTGGHRAPAASPRHR